MPYTPKIKENWDIRDNSSKERGNSSETTTPLPRIHSPGRSNVILGYREPK